MGGGDDMGVGGGDGGGRWRRRLDEEGVCPSDPELKPDEKTAEIQEQKSHSWNPSPSQPFHFAREESSGPEGRMWAMLSGQGEPAYLWQLPLPHCLMLHYSPFLTHWVAPSVVQGLTGIE